MQSHTSTDTAQLEGFGELVTAIMRDWNVPGLAVAIVRDGQVVLSEGFGLRDVERELPATSQTLFAIASCTKAFTTMALALLVDEGRLDWDTPVRRYLPELRLRDPVATERITVRDLVTHRSGLPRHDLVWYSSGEDREQVFRRLEYLEPSADLRGLWQYQNLMYMLAGYLLERIAGRAWEEFARRRIFEPLGMASSNLSVNESQRMPDHALGYRERDGELRRMDFYVQGAAGPAGGINSNVSDLSRWLLLHLNGGRHGDRQLVSEGQLLEMRSPQMVVQGQSRYDELPHQSYALGWVVEPYRGHELVHHGGNIDGFSSRVSLMPRDNMGVVVLSNLNGSPVPWIVTLNAYDRLLGLGEVPWSERLRREREEMEEARERGKGRSEAVRVTDTKPSHALESYTGEFEHPGYGTISFELEDDGLRATYHGMSSPVTHYHYDTFELTFEDVDKQSKATFHTSPRGDIESVSIPMEDSVDDVVFTRVPETPARLDRFVGDYELMGQNMAVRLKDGALLASIPGWPEVQLTPHRGTEFLVSRRTAFAVEFVEREDGSISEAVVTLPNGVFTATRR